MNLDELRKEKEKALSFKDIKIIRDKFKLLTKLDNLKIELNDTILIDGEISESEKKLINEIAISLKPWRKGPFQIFGTFIDSEWQSFIKYNLLKPHFNLKDKKVADIGCNNGYYLFRMLKEKPKKLVGFDPSGLYKSQFDFIEYFITSKITFEMLGVEDLSFYDEKFDVIFCLGVLYHRSDPISTLKYLYQGLEKGGELFLDTFMIDGENEFCLTPKKSYSKIPNVYFIPTIPALRNWLERAKFSDIEVLEIKKTDLNEQRKTEWILGESLNEFLDEEMEKTIEGYPAPKRVYIKARKN